MNLERFHFIAQSILEVLLNGVWGGFLIAAVAFIGIQVLSRWFRVNASTRYTVWVSSLLACVVVLIWQGSKSQGRLDSQIQNLGVTEYILEEPNFDQYTTTTATGESTNSLIVVGGEEALAIDAAPVEDNVSVAEPVYAPREETRTSVIELTPPAMYWQALFFAAWGVISGLLIMQLLLSGILVLHLKRTSAQAPAYVEKLVRRWSSQSRFSRAVRIGVSKGVKSAVAVGYIHPMILLPSAIFDVLSEEEIEQVILHEMAHIQRHDDWTILFQRVFHALFFFHPATWILSQQMEKDREMACDDWVVSLSQKPKVYASCLAKLASLHVRRTSYVTTPSATSGKKQLFERVESILNTKRVVTFNISALVYGCVLSLALLALIGMLSIVPTINFPDLKDKTVFASRTVVEVDAPTDVRVLPPADNVIVLEGDEPVYVVSTSSSIVEILPEKSTRILVETVDGARLEPTDSPQPVLRPRPLLVEERDVSSPSLRESTDGEPLSKSSMLKWFEVAKTISSPGDKASLLIGVLPKMHQDEDVIMAYLKAASTISSSSDCARTLRALINTHSFEKRSALQFLETVAKIPSTGEKTRVLMEALRLEAIPLSEIEVMDSLKSVMGTIHNHSDYNRVAGALIERLREIQH